MEENKKGNKKVIIVGISAILLIAILGISFAIWNYSRTTDNQILVAGDVYMKFKETPALTIENAIPSEGPGEKYFEFTIEGKNTYSKPIWYEIDLQYGENHATRKTRIKDNLLKFRLVEIKDGSEQTVVDNASYNNLTNKKIWVNTIAANTRSKVEITYRLYMWISSSTIIGNTSDAVYDMETWNNDVFASIKVNVAGDFNEKELEEEEKITLVDEVKSKLVKYEESSKESFSGGLVAINTDGTLYNETNNETIREYRYNGNTVNNYVKFNNELWRIVGVFKDDEEEIVKIVRNESLPVSYFPETYIVNGQGYKIKSNNNNYAYLNVKSEDNYSNSSDWTTSGLQYWLNSENDDNNVNKGYMNYLESNYKNMIKETIYYLGNVEEYDSYQGSGGGHSLRIDTPIEAYYHERLNTLCDENLEYDSYNEESGNCSIWYGNKSNWNGKVALLYPSDYGYSTAHSEWTKEFSKMEYGGVLSSKIQVNTSWIYKMIADYSVWLLSPASQGSFGIFSLIRDGAVYSSREYAKVLPTLYLQSTVKVTNGNGTENSPYELSL